MKRNIAVLSVIAVLLFFSSATFAQTGAELKEIKKDIQSLKLGQSAIQKDLQEIKRLLKTRPSPQRTGPLNVTLNVAGAHFKGEKNAVLTLIEFADFQ